MVILLSKPFKIIAPQSLALVFLLWYPYTFNSTEACLSLKWKGSRAYY